MNVEPIYVTMNQQRYLVERFWGDLPNGMRLGLVSTLAVTSEGVVVVAQRDGPAVIIFASDGTYLRAWGDDVADPHGINVDHDDRVILVDRDAHEIQFRDLDGERLGELGDRHHPRLQAPFNHPTSAFVARDGECYVADGYGNSAVHRFAVDGTLLSTWGSPGSGPGEFTTPHSIWVDRQDRVLVADRENNRVQVFDRCGVHLASWGDFHHPMDISEDEDGYIYVSDQIPRLSQLDSNGRLVGRCRPVWNTPHGIACGPNGVIYSVEMNPRSLTKLTPVTDAST